METLHREKHFLRQVACLSASLLLAVALPLLAMAEATGTVKTDSLVLRKSNSKESKALQTLSKGDTMEVLSKSGSWYKVRYGKYTGYVMKKYVTVSGAIEDSSSSTKESSSARPPPLRRWGMPPRPASPGTAARR